MKTREDIANATVNVFEAENCLFMFNRLSARQIFMPDRKNRLNVAYAMPCAIVTSIHQKFGTRRMGVINEA